MTAIYEIELWKVILPWCLFAIAVIGNAVGWWIAWVLNRSNNKAQEKVHEMGLGMNKANENRYKAECESRESAAAHQEALRKLEEANKKLLAVLRPAPITPPITPKTPKSVKKKGGKAKAKKSSKRA